MSLPQPVQRFDLQPQQNKDPRNSKSMKTDSKTTTTLMSLRYRKLYSKLPHVTSGEGCREDHQELRLPGLYPPGRTTAAIHWAPETVGRKIRTSICLQQEFWCILSAAKLSLRLEDEVPPEYLLSAGFEKDTRSSKTVWMENVRAHLFFYCNRHQ